MSNIISVLLIEKNLFRICASTRNKGKWILRKIEMAKKDYLCVGLNHLHLL